MKLIGTLLYAMTFSNRITKCPDSEGWSPKIEE